MRIIQSYWSCRKSDLITDQPGWLAPEYHLMSLALSALQLKKHYKDLVLYADSTSAKLLIDELNLPYTEVHCELDKLNKYHPELWALPKIHVYAKQNVPFLHIDGDVFIWKPFEEKLIQNELVAQNMESATVYYSKIMNELEANLKYFPIEILEERTQKNPIHAYNAGIFGGQDTIFFQEYARKAFEFVNKNETALSKIRVGNFNIFFEQYLFYCLAKKRNKTVGVLFEDIIGDNQYKGFGDFIEVPYNKQYLHLLGNYKRSKTVCLQLADRLRQDYPEYYYKIIKLYKDLKHPLFQDYYHDMDNDVDLLKRHKKLKQEYKDGLLENKKTRVLNKRNSDEVKRLEYQFIEGVQLDLNLFLKKTEIIKKKKFSTVSADYLYGRDLNATAYFEYLFADLNDIYLKSLVAQPYTQFLTSKYDWSDIDNPAFDTKVVSQKPSSVITVIIPECSKLGYSLANIDLLDVEILDILKTKKTIGRLLNECQRSFEKKEIESSKEEYIKLITGRIKKGIYNKTIQVVF